jgi:hypothetical protein
MYIHSHLVVALILPYKDSKTDMGLGFSLYGIEKQK